MLHGDAGILFNLNKSRSEGQTLVNEILDYFVLLGTVIVPTFTYSATRSESFNPTTTPSRIGQFSELFRTNNRMTRTHHPNFSVCVYGKKRDEVLGSRTDDAFGEGTFFDFLYKENAELITIGCSLNAITFAHYVEQQRGVSYRFMKSFLATVEVYDGREEFTTSYYVRDLDCGFDANLDLTRFRERGIQSKQLRIAELGRLECAAIKAQDCLMIMSKMLGENQLSLVKGTLK